MKKVILFLFIIFTWGLVTVGGLLFIEQMSKRNTKIVNAKRLFNKGDCIVFKSQLSETKNFYRKKVVAVGKNSYIIRLMGTSHLSRVYFIFNNDYIKVSCK